MELNPMLNEMTHNSVVSDDEVHFRPPKRGSRINKWAVAMAMVTMTAIVVCLLIWFIRPKCKATPSAQGMSQDFQLYLVPKKRQFDGGRIIANVSDVRINEASGLAVSRRHNDVIYTFNDSGGKNRLFALSARDGSTLAVFTIRDAANCDWEDITLGPGPNGHTYIYIGDVGGNAILRCDTIYMVREPEVIEDMELIPYNIIPYTWPEQNCETLMVHPNGALYLITKVTAGNMPRLYSVPEERVRTPGDNSSDRVPLIGGSPIVLQSPSEAPVAGDISQTGREILLKNYNSILLYDVIDGEKVERALQHLPNSLRYTKEKQGEAIGWDSTSSGFYTLSEGVDPKRLPSRFRYLNILHVDSDVIC